MRSLPHDPRKLLAIYAGGVVGALIRVGLAQIASTSPGQWPWATFAVNILGAFLLGSLMTGLRHGPVSIPTYRLLGTGFCGALTTFSTMQLELVNLLDARAYAQAAGYLIVSVVLGYAAVQLASAVVRR